MHFNHTSLAAKKHKPLLLRELDKVIESGIALAGKQVKTLEKRLSKLLGSETITVASGHDALVLALQALTIKNGDEVIFPANAYPTLFPIAQVGATPVPVDIDETLQIDPSRIELAITKKTKAIVVVHMYGHASDMTEIMAIAKRHSIYVIEDCAQAFGAKFGNRYVGTIGDIGCFSFYPTKNLGTFGDGGAVCSKNQKVIDYIKKARQYGEKERYKSEFIAGHSRLPELQAAILNIYLRHMHTDFKRRKKLYEVFTNAITSYVQTPVSHKDSDSVPHLFVVRAKDREALQAFLKKKKIPTIVHYPLSPHLMKGSYPTATQVAKEILSLPFHPYLTKEEIHYIADTLKAFYNKAK